jgi:curved DNA-binding protein CbpA
MFTSPLSASPYEVLGIAPGASDDEIRRAYRVRARRTHPDVGGDAAEFIQVQQAWELLGSAASRAAYDHGAEESGWAKRQTRPRGSRLGAKSFGTAGGWRREFYVRLVGEWAGDVDVYSSRVVREAQWEQRRLLADALAEEATASAVERMGIGFTAWHGIDLGEETLDHVVLGPTGLYALSSEDFGGPVRFRGGEPLGSGVSGRTPVDDLARRARIVARSARVRFGGAILILPDDDLAESAVVLGEARGILVAAVRRSALALALRRGIPGARTVGGNEVFDVRTRLAAAVRVR